MSPTIIHALATTDSTISPHEPAAGEMLTNREKQVLALMLEGQSNGEIAQQLQLTPQTVRNYVHHIYQKFQVSSRAELLLATDRIPQ